MEALLTITEGSRGAMHLWDFCTLPFLLHLSLVILLPSIKVESKTDRLYIYIRSVAEKPVKISFNTKVCISRRRRKEGLK